MGDEGVVAFCEPLQSVSGGYVELLDLGSKGMTEDGIVAVAKSFGSSPYLKELNLSRNLGIGNLGIERFCSNITATNSFQNLQRLILSSCGIGDDGIRSLCKTLAKLGNSKNNNNNNNKNRHIELSLNDNTFGPAGCDAIGRDLLPSGAVQSLSLIGCRIGDPGMISLCDAALQNTGCADLKTLDLSQNGITANGARALAGCLWKNETQKEEKKTSCMPALEELVMAGNPLGSEGVQSIVQSLCQGTTSANTSAANTNTTTTSPRLSVLNLADTNCGTDGAVCSLGCPSLRRLRLFGNKIGSDGFAAIAPLLRGGHPHLIELDLGGNNAERDAVNGLLRSILLGSETAAVGGFRFQSTLVVLEIGGNETGQEEESLINQEMKRVHPKLDIARDKPKSQT
eukprot:CAMPEP_0202448356 /NCGR_PEP_ID=MMETSP1360-20130828/7168_1 /ASSEMBLY_ACC=CAM_ASM_000848 /TAXON_ID=515479 /ORGANISM="Licmophora paradoxa, Strain CCMP2313" /LENGTH=398 /DNA_ID=CAMNT_0049065881 /DNA_START=77 /DNA_END=1273 /DNA_ORIENTATION=-